MMLILVLLSPYGLLLWREFSLPIRLLFAAMVELIIAPLLLICGIYFDITVIAASGYLIEFVAILIIGANLFIGAMIAISRKR